MEELLHELLHALLDTINVFLVIFLLYILLSFIEDKITKKFEKSSKFSPIYGALIGIIPQCGFSVLATNLYVTRIISLGTLIAIYLSTSDEMLPILISQKADFNIILKLLITKFIIGMIFGFIIDFIIRKRNKKEKLKVKEDYSICDDEHCHCGKENIILSSIKHTLKTLLFIFIATFILNALMEFLGNEFIEKIFMKNSIFSPFISSLVGLIPNCGSSIILTELYMNNVISFSNVISGLLTGSGVAILVLFKTNKNLKENLTILSLVYLMGVLSGMVINIVEILL